jgi:hypothetical protein
VNTRGIFLPGCSVLKGGLRGKSKILLNGMNSFLLTSRRLESKNENKIGDFQLDGKWHSEVPCIDRSANGVSWAGTHRHSLLPDSATLHKRHGRRSLTPDLFPQNPSE